MKGLVARTTAACALAVAAATLPTAQIDTPRPGAVFGFEPCADYSLATYEQALAYFRALAAARPDRIRLEEIGHSSQGRPQVMAIISSEENLANLDALKAISKRLALAQESDRDGGSENPLLPDANARQLAARGKAVVWIDFGLHASEVATAQAAPSLAYNVVTGESDEMRAIRHQVVFLLVPNLNPDGTTLVAEWYRAHQGQRWESRLPELWHPYVGHDNNRDWFMMTQRETRNASRQLYEEWFPQIVYDHHQAAPAGSVMFVPPFRGPFNPAIDPLIRDGIELVGGAMRDRFAAEGKGGLTPPDSAEYSVWWNGGLRTTPYFHNQIGILTETLGSPTPGRDWRFRQAIDYSLTANRAVLDAASRHRQALLFNMYRMGRNAIERGAGGTRAYVLPAGQPDFPTATKFVNALLSNGVAVERAARPFSVGATRYPAGSYVVRTAQAFGPHVIDMFEPQHHPDDIPQTGGAPRPPYDNAGWTLAFQMGVKFDRVLEEFDGAFEPLAGIAKPPAGRVVLPPALRLSLRAPRATSRGEGGSHSGYVVSHAPNDAFIVVNRLLKAGEHVFWPGPTSMYIAARSSTRPMLERAAAELGLTFTGVSQPPAAEALQLRPVRIALADNTGGSVPSGWIRWILERYEFAFDVLTPGMLEDGDLRRYDVLIFPDDVVPDRRAASRLQRWVDDGGTLVAMGRATGVSTHFGLPVSNPLAGLKPEQYFVPGSVLRVRVDNTLPAAYGFEPEADVFFDNSPVFRLEPGAAARGVRPIAWFATGTPLRSGWAWGQAYLKDAVVALEAPVGRGRLLLFGPEVTFRAQSHGTFKFLFNSLYYGSGTNAPLH